jgi:hypothetical protein
MESAARKMSSSGRHQHLHEVLLAITSEVAPCEERELGGAAAGERRRADA